jgi:hypothetical protein
MPHFILRARPDPAALGEAKQVTDVHTETSGGDPEGSSKRHRTGTRESESESEQRGGHTPDRGAYGVKQPAELLTRG